MEALNKKNYSQYFDQLRAFTEATSPISDNSWAKMCDIANLWRAPKGTRLLDYMNVESSVRFLGKGIVKCEDHYNGESFVYDFRVAPIILSETVSFFSGQPSRITLETVTECDILELPREEFIKLIYSNLDISTFAIKGVANYLGMTHYKQALLRTLDAELRYKQFLKEFPSVSKDGKLEDIASYINVTQQSLSRIRKNIKWEEGESQLEALSHELAVVHGKENHPIIS